MAPRRTPTGRTATVQPPITSRKRRSHARRADDHPQVAATDNVAAGARQIIGCYLSQVRASESATRAGKNPEALHDMRVAVRRLRAAVRALRLGIPFRLREGLEVELKWLGDLLGAVRDVDVQLDRLAQYRTLVPRGHRNGLRSFLLYLDDQRTRHRTELLGGLHSPRYARLLLQLDRFTASAPPRGNGTQGWRAPLAAVGGRVLQNDFRTLLKRGRKLETLPSPEDLHTLRTRTKRLRYVIDFLRAVLGKRGHRLVKRLVRLQDVLGIYHDRIVTADYVRRYVQGPGKHESPAPMKLSSTAARHVTSYAAKAPRWWCSISRFLIPTASRCCGGCADALKPASSRPSPSLW